MSEDSTPLRAGMERHLWPAGNGQGIITRTSSDAIFGPKGLGLGNTIWTTIVSYLARTGIQEQTGSNPDETNIENCVKGWGQGAYSSRVFNADIDVDQEQLERLITHLEAIASDLAVPNHRITNRVLGAFVSTQNAEPYLTSNGVREIKTWRNRLTAIFRGHVQWQGFVTLCGQIDLDGVKHVSPELIREFFDCERPFFDQVIDRRRSLKDGSLPMNDKSGLLASAPSYVDIQKTNSEYKKNKSGLWLILRIGKYMLFPRKSKVGPLPRHV